MKRIIFIISGILFLTSCISLRVEYPEIHYYRLSHHEGTFQNIGLGTIDGTLQIRNFSVSDEVDTDHFLAIWGDTKVQRYYYHRWIANCADLITNFMLTRYNDLRVFTGGVVKPGSVIIPDYIMDGQVIDMVAYNGEDDDKKANYVYISLRISLLKKVPLSTDKTILLNKIFTVKTARKNNSVETIAPAFSKAVSQISDKMLIEIQDAIIKDRKPDEN
ncbi:hypothetical protein ACFLSQ_00645 [Bacteroidota bacterium]